MTYVLTGTQLTDLQADLDVGSAGAVFTDAELNRLFDRAAGNYTYTIVLALRQLLTSASKWADYTVGQTDEKRSQRAKQLMDLLTYYEDRVLNGEQQVAITGVRSVPTRVKDRPADLWWPPNWTGGGRRGTY